MPTSFQSAGASSNFQDHSKIIWSDFALTSGSSEDSWINPNSLHRFIRIQLGQHKFRERIILDGDQFVINVIFKYQKYV